MARVIMEDMSPKSNLLATCRKSEMEYLDTTPQQLVATRLGVSTLGFTPCDTAEPLLTSDSQAATNPLARMGSITSNPTITENWNMDELLDSQQLAAVANSLDVNGLNWFEDLLQYGDEHVAFMHYVVSVNPFI
jgi:hypothetical protein